MSDNPFNSCEPHILKNEALRIPQRDSHKKLIEFVAEDGNEKEVGIVLPVGCGKSGCITNAPFAFKSLRTLVVAPNIKIAEQLYEDCNPSNAEAFCVKRGVLNSPPFPEPAEIRGKTTNRGDLDDAHVVITNIDQLQGKENRWLISLPDDYFDLILFDEGHHNVASSWKILKKKFSNAYIVNYSATPLRADGKLMAGKIIYSYPVCEAIKQGYIKRLKAIVLNPTTLKYVRPDEGGQEIEVGLDEVRKLGEEDAAFRRSIVTSTESLSTIVNASIHELQKIRKETGDKRLKIIASALNYDHCRQIVEAYRARGLKTDYVHSKENSKTNDRVLQKLKNHELDVIVQVRKLGEGFDHRHLSVAAIFSIFSNLSPFVQFVGRIMRTLDSDPNHVLNQGTVIFHAGANVARQWGDFQEFSGADQEYFDQLLPMEGLNFNSNDEITIEPVTSDDLQTAGIEVQAQDQVIMEEIPLLDDDPEIEDILKSKGITPEQYRKVMELKPIITTKVQERQAKRASLDMRVKNTATKILAKKGINPMGHELDKKHLGYANLIVVKSTIDRCIRKSIGKKSGERSEYTRADLDKIDSSFNNLVKQATNQIFDA